MGGKSFWFSLKQLLVALVELINNNSWNSTSLARFADVLCQESNENQMGGSDLWLLMQLTANGTNHLVTVEEIILSQCFNFYLFLKTHKIFSNFQRKVRKFCFSVASVGNVYHSTIHSLKWMAQVCTPRGKFYLSVTNFARINPLGSNSHYLLSSKL